MTSWAVSNLRRQIPCFRPPPTPPQPPSSPTAGEIEHYKYNHEVVLLSTSVFNDSSKTDGSGWARLEQQETDMAATLWKQRSLPREDLASVATRRCFNRRWSRRGSSHLDASYRCRRYVRRLYFLPSVISAGWFYFGILERNYILFYRKFSHFVLMIHSIGNSQILFWML